MKMINLPFISIISFPARTFLFLETFLGVPNLYFSIVSVLVSIVSPARIAYNKFIWVLLRASYACDFHISNRMYLHGIAS
ncbi:hypothetical protein ACFLR8_04800, partial [Bacteroidota bacterium]